MAEVADNGSFGVLEGHFSWQFEPGVAFCAIALSRKCCFAVVASATGLTFFHVSHADPLVFLHIRFDNACMAILAAVSLGMEGVAEGCLGNRRCLVA